MTIKVTQSYNPQLKPLSMANMGIALFHSVQDLPHDWERAQPADNLFLQRPYLTILEENPPIGMKFCYILFYRGQDPIGVALGQLQHFKASNSLSYQKEEEGKSKTLCFFTAYSRFLKNFLASKMEFNTLVCGNLLLTGEHGFYIKEGAGIDTQTAQHLLVEAMDIAKVEIEERGLPLSAMLIKDYYPSSKPAAKALLDKSFNEFTVQPNMVLNIRPDWKCWEDCLADYQSKYRVRAKRAVKKGSGLRKEEFSLEDIIQYLPRMYELYTSVAENSGFNLINLNTNYLVALKRDLPEAFRCFAYFDEQDRLVAYYTTIGNGIELEAHFLGFAKELNKSHQIYLNILYDLVRIGIEGGYEKLVFARTAMGIKSTVGAEAIDMYCYVRHRSALTNKLIHTIYDYLKPADDWIPRHPFKEGV